MSRIPSLLAGEEKLESKDDVPRARELPVVAIHVQLFSYNVMLLQFAQLRLATQMGRIITSMNDNFDKLTNLQAQFMTVDPSKTQWGVTELLNVHVHVCNMDPHECTLMQVPLTREMAKLKEDVLATFAQCTKDDVTINNYISRSRILGLVFYILMGGNHNM